jgi:TRAP-type C4-dicarboxylate transport system permease small subunit
VEQPPDVVGRPEVERGPAALLDRLCRWLALVGGVMLCCAGLVTVISVGGRYFFNDAISGDSEIVSNLTAIAVALFLPYCQLAKGNVVVDVFTEHASEKAKALLDALGSLLLLLIAGVIAWRLGAGGLGLRAAHDETMVLRLPTWWAFVPIVPAFALLAVASAVTAWRDLAPLRRARG